MGAVACAVTVAAGVLAAAETASFLWGLSFATVPITLALQLVLAPKIARVVVWVWATVVFPVSVVVPAIMVRGCMTPECIPEDFGGGVALFATAGACALVAARGSIPRRGGAPLQPAALGVLLACGIVWLVSLEGAIDAYSPRLFAASVFATLGGAFAWWLTRVMRGHAEITDASPVYGALLGFVAIVPGAATVDLALTPVVGALAGAFGALLVSGGAATAVLFATVTGVLAPGVSGAGRGLIFSGRIGTLLPPTATFLAVGVFSALVTALALWVRRRTRGEERRGCEKRSPRSRRRSER